MSLSNLQQQTLNAIIQDLQAIPDVTALVLGGSHATGFATESSDLDIGIYYRQEKAFSIDEIRRVAEKYHREGGADVTGFYQWGAWVNGGAWLNTDAGEVDFVYRNIDQVRDTLTKASEGIWENDYEQQPPYGFSSTIYLAETFYCIPLYDPEGIISELKTWVATYPPKLQASVIQQAMWAAEFTLWQAEKFAQKADLYNAAGCITRALKKIIDALFAINRQYPIGDKSAIEKLEACTLTPSDIRQQVALILTISPSTIIVNVGRLRSLFDQVRELAGDRYRPYFQL